MKGNCIAMSERRLPLWILLTAVSLEVTAKASRTQAENEPIPWRMLVLVYRNLDATYLDKAGIQQHVTHSMSDADYAYFLQAISRLPNTISTWSAGKAAMTLTIVTVNEPIRTLNSGGEPSEYEALREIATYNPGGIYDSISMVYSRVEGWVAGYASVGLSGAANSAGFSVIHFPVNYAAWGSTYPDEIIVHEWLHNVEGYYRSWGYDVPNLHDAPVYGYTTDPAVGDSWHRWYEDYTQNRVWNGTAYVGVPAEAWQTHVPTGPVLGSIPPTPVPTSPANHAVNVSPQTVFNWAAASGALWYGLQVSIDPAFTANVVDRWVGSTQYQIIDLRGGQTYYYRVRALNVVGVSAWSSPLSFTTATDSAQTFGSALRFDGANDHVRIMRQVGDDFTLEAWIKTTSSDSGYAPWDGRPVIYADLPDFDAKDFCTGIVSSKFVFSIGGPDVMVRSTTSVNQGAWIHVAAVRVRQASTIKVYVNGHEEAVQAGATTDALATPRYVDIGGNTVNNRFFDGLMDEVRIWNVARTPAEIAANANRRLTGTEPGLVGYWRMDEGSGENARDSSPSGNDGSLRYGPIWVPSTAPLTGSVADLDFDGDVDAADLRILQLCVSGPAVSHSGTPACQSADFDHDSDVDQSDFGLFQRCFIAPGGISPANCGT